MDSQIIFRILAIIVGAGIGFFSYKIITATKGGSKGWLYIALAGLGLFFAGTIFSVFTFIDVAELRLLNVGILYPLIGIFMATAFFKLLEDFGIYKPQFITQTKITIFCVVVYVLPLLYSFVVAGNDIITAMGSAGVFGMTLQLLVALIGSFMIFKKTGVSVWLAYTAFAVLIVLGTISATYSSNCCSENAIEACEEYKLDYGKVYPTPCTPGLVKASIFGYNFNTLGLLTLLVTQFLLMRKFTRPM